MLLRSLAFLIIWSETSHKAEPSEGSQAQKRAKVEEYIVEYMGAVQKPKWN